MTASHYNPESVEAFYSKDAALEWERLVRTAEQEVKLHIHNHYLYQYLSDGCEVLEVGAGPGRFTKTLHDIGCSVLVSDISAIQLDANREKATQLEFDKSVVDWVRADVTNLERFASESFDAVVATEYTVPRHLPRPERAGARRGGENNSPRLREIEK